MENEILNLLLETLKIQAEKYKVIVNDDSLTHDQRKEFDTEITQMYNVLANLSNSSTVYTLAELKALKAQYDVKFAEFDEKVKNLDLSHLLVSFDSLTQEQKDSLKGEKGDKGEDGLNGTFEDLTQEQKDSLKGRTGDTGRGGATGLSAYEIAVNIGFEGTQSEWLESLKGENGTFENLTQEQKNILFEEFKVLIDLTSILTRLETLENGSSTPAIMEKTLTYKQSETGYNILTNFVPNEGETGIFLLSLSADGSKMYEFRFDFTFDSSLPYYQSFNDVYHDDYQQEPFTFSPYFMRSKDNNLILSLQVLSVGGEPTASDIILSLKIETEQNHPSLNFIGESDSDDFVRENWTLG